MVLLWKNGLGKLRSVGIRSLHQDGMRIAGGRSMGVVERERRAYSTMDRTGLIMRLRERSSAPMKDVKAALVQNDWDPEAAFTELRKKGLASLSKKSSRVTAEGLLALAEDAGSASIIELNSETDFVARNDIFQHLAQRVARAALSVEASQVSPQQAANINMEALEGVKIVLEHPKLKGAATVQEAIKEASAIMGENIRLRRGFRLSALHGVVSSYLHLSQQEGLARTAGLLTMEVENGGSSISLESLKQVGDSLAMHIVAARPLFLSKEYAPSEALEKEREILRTQAAATNKPAVVIDKMIEGRMAKYFEEVSLLDQKYVINDKVNIRKVLSDLSQEVGRPVHIGSFLRLEVGEGIQREEKSFAADVAAQVG